MPARTSFPPGTFVWADLATPSLDAAKGFYGPLLGWEFEDVPGGAMAQLHGAAAAALFQQPGVPPHWNSYASVVSAEETAGRAAELGGTVVEPAFDVGAAGRLAALRDPEGAFVCLWQPGEHIGAGVVNEPGALTWNHLFTSDIDAAERFYSELLGWRFESEDGQPGMRLTYVGERTNGSASPLTPEMGHVPPNWSVFFGVADLEATQSQAIDLGATLLVGPTPAGPGRFIAVADPTGAPVSFYAGEFDD